MTPERPGSSSENQSQLNAEKARRAARHPNRPGEKCAADAGAYQPVIDRNACEGKRDCVEVCPYGVFEVRRINDEDFSGLSFLGKLKSRAPQQTVRVHATGESLSGVWTLCGGLSGKGNHARCEPRFVRRAYRVKGVGRDGHFDRKCLRHCILDRALPGTRNPTGRRTFP